MEVDRIMNIETQRLLIRNFCKNDIDLCYQSWGQDKSLGKYIILYPMTNIHQMEDFVKGLISNINAWVIMNKKLKVIVGYIIVDIPYKQLGIAEIGYVIGEKYHRQGYAFEAINCILKEYLINQRFYLIEAKCNETNKASLKLLEKLGFQLDGKLRDRRINLLTGERNDLIVLSITQNEFINRK